jgi:radical SAM superfamily enzyme YgiQ (UPF0313 family)
MVKLLLVTSSFEENTAPEYADREKSLERRDGLHYALGISYLHAYMESRGHDVRSLFLNSFGWDLCFEDVARALKEFQPEIVGFQMLTQNRVSSYKLMEYIHTNYPEMKIVAGGVHATVMYEQLVKKFPYLTVVLGEGELTLDELAGTLKNGGELEKVEGIAFNRNGEVVKTDMRPLIKDLDILPFPKHALHFDRNRNFGALLTSRGCPCRCSFCALDSISRGVNRTRSVKNVMEEIEYMIQAFPQMRLIWIHDDTFFLDNARVMELCDEIIKRKIKMEFVCSGRIKPFSEKMARKLEEANFTKILFGLESGVDDILIKAHKGITQKTVLETFEILARTKLDVMCFLIVGLPGETEKTVLETAGFVKKLQRMKYVRYGDISTLMIYPGTEVCRIAKEKGQITDELWLTDAITPFYEVENSYAELERFKKLLLDNIAIDSIGSLDALKSQWEMVPYAAGYFAGLLWRRRRELPSKLVSKVARRVPMLNRKAAAPIRGMG